MINFQSSIRNWIKETFGTSDDNVIAWDKRERSFRFFEEATELVQSHSITREECDKILDYVFSRPVGEPSQEVGGVMVTLAGLCCVTSHNIYDCGWKEYNRINTPEMREKIRNKQVSKRLAMP